MSGFRVFSLNQPAKLSYQKAMLKVQLIKEDEPIFLPLEDLSCVLLASESILLSQGLLCRMAEYGIACICVNKLHLPQAVNLPLQAPRSVESINAQIKATPRFKGRF